jgi:predicted nucleotidyltransferase
MAPRPREKTGRALTYRYLPPNIPMSAIRGFAGRIAERFDPEKIILFGSFARGTPHSDSDVDLLVVMPASNEINQSIRITLAFDPVFPLDLIVRTPERLRRGLAQGEVFLKEIASRGIVLYEKRHPGVGTESLRMPPNSNSPRNKKNNLQGSLRRSNYYRFSLSKQPMRMIAFFLLCKGVSYGQAPGDSCRGRHCSGEWL